jgi:CRP-like cAMP-binding protein
MPAFVKYCRIHNIDQDYIIQAANYLNCKFIAKDEYVFKQMEDSDAFFGVIRGKVSIQSETYQYIDEGRDILKGRTKRVTINLKVPRNNAESFKLIENRLFVLSDGYCFGEWGLVNDTKRAASAKAIEDTYLFYLEKKEFKNTLNQCFAKLTADRKTFIRETVLPFKNQAIYEKYSSAVSPIVNILNTVSRKRKYYIFRKHSC